MKIVASTENLPYEEWLELRKKGIGGSDASVVCGINRYKTPIELWIEKTDNAPPQEAEESAYWGTQLESIVREEFTKRTGIEVKLVKQLLHSEEHPFMLANLDGICHDPNYGDCIFEAKTASAFKLSEWENAIPDEYMLQLQHYMAVMGCKAAYIAVLIGGNTFRWRLIERDEELIPMLIELEARFWEHVKNNTPPPLDGSEACAKYLAVKYSDSTATSVELPDEAENLIKEYNIACEKVECSHRGKTVCREQVEAIAG